MKKSFYVITATLIACAIDGGLVKSYKKKDSARVLLAHNVEALTQGEQTDHYWCCGNTGTCAKGNNVEIKGKLETTPCK